jgi:hypothetical protein
MKKKKNKKQRVVFAHVYYPYYAPIEECRRIWIRVKNGLVNSGWTESNRHWKYNRTAYVKGDRVFYL